MSVFANLSALWRTNPGDPPLATDAGFCGVKETPFGGAPPLGAATPLGLRIDCGIGVGGTVSSAVGVGGSARVSTSNRSSIEIKSSPSPSIYPWKDTGKSKPSNLPFPIFGH